MKLLERIRETGELVRFSHTVFALPFALIAALAAAHGFPPWQVLAWIVIAMVGARTAAMAFNRLADHAIDAANPRTASRPLPSGRMGRGFAWAVVVAGIAALFVAAWRLNPLCLTLAPFAAAWVLLYSYAKRFTLFSHFWLGLGLGTAPVGAWIAVRGRFDVPPLVLALAVTAWVAGFDVIYSLQDEAFDREHGLHSIPARLGTARALLLARFVHLISAGGFAAFALLMGGGWGLWAGFAAACVLLVWQHSLLAPGRLARLDAAFFTANGTLSVVMFVLYVLDIMLRR